MSKTIDTVSTVVVSTDGIVTSGEFWVQNSGLIDCSDKHGLNVELKATFANDDAVAGDLIFYIVRSNDGGTDITSSFNAEPISIMTPVQNSVIVDVVPIRAEFDDLIGFAVKNTDSTFDVSDVSISYKTVTL